jgi:shikimate dehydrogenase
MVRAIYAIIGDPIGQARSPEVFNARFAQHGIDAVMVPLEVPSRGLAIVLDGLRATRNFGGAVITVPHKIAVAEFAQEKSTRVRIAGAANVLKPTARGWSADLFDGTGFVAGLAAQGFPVKQRSVAIVGAGGAGLAIAAALLEAGAGSIGLSDRDPQKTASAIARLSENYPERASARLPGPSDTLVVNATPTGMALDDPLPVDLDRLHPQAIIAEAIMKPAVTRLLAEASRRGHPTLEGRHMLDGQIEAIWTFFADSDCANLTSIGCS